MSSPPVRPWHHIGLGLFVATCHMLYFLGWSMDDPFITFRYAEHVATGLGFVFNPGEAPVEGFSNLLWLLILVPIHRLFGPDALFPASQAIGFACAMATGPLLAWLWQRTGPPAKDAWPLWRWLPLYAWALSSPAMLWGVGGLETPMVALLITGALAMIGEGWHDRGSRSWMLALILWLLAISRPEGAMFGLGFYALWATRRPSASMGRSRLPIIASFCLFAAGLALMAIWRWQVFGSVLPNTYYAKMGGPLGFRLGMGARHLVDLLAISGALPVIAWVGLWSWNRSPAIRAAALFAALQLGFTLWVGGDWMPAGRFLIPALPCLILLGTAGIRRGWDGFTALTPKRAVRDLLILLLLGWFGAMMVGGYAATREVVHLLRADQLQRPLVEVAQWIEIHADEGDTLAGEEAGIIPYATRRGFLDLLAINDPHLARLPGPMHGKMDVEYVVNRWRPDWVLLITTPDPGPLVYGTGAGQTLATSDLFRACYTEVHQVPREMGARVTRIFERIDDEVSSP